MRFAILYYKVHLKQSRMEQWALHRRKAGLLICQRVQPTKTLLLARVSVCFELERTLFRWQLRWLFRLNDLVGTVANTLSTHVKQRQPPNLGVQ